MYTVNDKDIIIKKFDTAHFNKCYKCHGIGVYFILYVQRESIFKYRYIVTCTNCDTHITTSLYMSSSKMRNIVNIGEELNHLI